jgi:NhaP-type Na+/H+ or K+/H+ antiporter
MPLAVGPGLEVPDAFAAGLLFVGFALFAAIGALSGQEERPFSASVVYLLLGLLAAAGIHLLDLEWLDPFDDAGVVEHLTEFALMIALFAAGLTIRWSPEWRRWRTVALLIVVVMPLTIAAVAAIGALALGLSFGAAVVLGAILAPTDPVLAGSVGSGPPGEPEGSAGEARFDITAEASLNDALASPFVLLGIFILERQGEGWLAEWLVADVLYAVAGGLAAGALAGFGLAAAALRMRERQLLAPELDGFVVVGAVLVVYGAVNALDMYGLLAVFAAGVAFRFYETGHEYNRRIHDGAIVAENFLELAVILVLGSLVTFDGLAEPGLAGWALAPIVILLVRPAAILAVLTRSPRPPRERLFLGLFGVRGVASVYYAAFVIGQGSLSTGDERLVFWTTAVVVMTSVLVHGVTASAASRRFLPA